jgi:hypothetical protein
MAEVVEVRTDQANFDLVFPEQVTAMYADGISNAAIGFPVSKLFFHTTEPPRQIMQDGTAPPIERRKVVLEMTIPTAALVELCANIASSASQSRDSLMTGANNMVTLFSNVLDKLGQPG